MLKKDSSYLTKLWILHCFLEFSHEVKGRRTYFCLKDNDFRKKEKVEQKSKPSFTGTDAEIDTINKEGFGISRKIFQKHQKELLTEKLITRVKTSDKRSKYYSITPFGICYLIKSEYFTDPMKITVKMQKKIFPILETFATRYVTYKSEISEKGKFDFKEFYDKLVKNVIDEHDIGEEIPHIFSSFDFDSQLERLEFSFEFYVESPMKIILANFKDMGKSEIILSELGQKEGVIFSKYESIKLSEEQFHHYLASLLLLLIVYFHFQIRHLFIPSNYKKEIHDYKNLPDYILQILSIFNLFIGKRIKEEAEYMEKFTQIINQTQVKK